MVTKLLIIHCICVTTKAVVLLALVYQINTKAYFLVTYVMDHWSVGHCHIPIGNVVNYFTTS